MKNSVKTSLDVPVQEKYLKLRELLRLRLPEGLMIAFSGGVDSAFLVWAAEQERRSSGGRLAALTTLSESFSQAERVDAGRFSETHSIRHFWHESKELLNPQYALNDLNRCFYCKTELFNICREVAGKHDLKWIAYGYNASDGGDFRPGHKAAVENAILSPLADAGLTKDDIRFLMREHGLEMADKPASPCLSSRLMTGVFITPGKLNDVEYFENILRDGGLKVFRVRLHEEGSTKFLRLEVAPDEIQKAIECRESLVKESSARGYKWVTLDLGGYRTGGGNLIAK
jgi:uncharacterized protein